MCQPCYGCCSRDVVRDANASQQYRFDVVIYLYILYWGVVMVVQHQCISNAGGTQQTKMKESLRIFFVCSVAPALLVH